MKRLVLLLALCVFSYGLPGNKKSDKQYRCFAKIGKSVSTTQNSYIPGKYCIPSPHTDNCTKSWKWELDKKNDTVTEEGKDCQFKCEGGDVGAYSDTQPETYQYCVYQADFHKVAQCVDKQEGKDADKSLCEGDSNGTRYYYKPKCGNAKSAEECERALSSISVQYGWRFCYNASGHQGYDIFKTMPGQTVLFQEYINQAGTASFPCNQYSSSPGGGNPPEPEKPGEIVIRDWENCDSGLTQSIVWTKVSGTRQTSFKINTLDKSGKFGSGIKSLYCSIDGKAKAQAYETFTGCMGISRVYRYNAKGVPFPFTGYHTLYCEGADKDGKSIAGEVKFYSAPSYYSYDIWFTPYGNKDEVKFVEESKYNEDENKINKDDKVNPIKVYHNSTADTTVEYHYLTNKWTKKPVVKVGESLAVLANITPYTAENKKDVENIEIVSVTNTNTLKKITSVPNTTTAQSCGNLTPAIATKPFKPDTDPKPDPDTILTLSSQNSILGTIELTMQNYTTITNIIKGEEASGKCNKHKNHPCPYPGVMKLVFDYQVVPRTFDIELLNANNQQLKVLYFGQGSNTSVENPNKIKIKAYGLSNNPDTKFSSGCAAQDIAVNLDTKGTGYSIKLVDGNGVDIATVPAKEFKNGVAEASVYIKVMKADGIDFTPNMKSEPVFLKGGFPASITFAGFSKYPNSYYPEYDGLKANNNDMVILRGRINAIDTDNVASGSKTTPSPTKVYYEFQCEYCDLSKLQQITGVANYQAQKSKTQQGWFIDSTFAAHNTSTLNKNMVSIENQGSGAIKNVKAFNNGIQEIEYGALALGVTHKVNILHGNYVQGGNAIAMPNFLLYNAYWNPSTKWNTSAFIYMKGTAPDDKLRDYGLDTDGAKNTRSGGRTGNY